MRYTNLVFTNLYSVTYLRINCNAGIQHEP